MRGPSCKSCLVAIMYQPKYRQYTPQPRFRLLLLIQFTGAPHGPDGTKVNISFKVTAAGLLGEGSWNKG